MTSLRSLAVVAMVVVAMVLQLGVFPAFAISGVVPDVVLLVVISVALARGPEYAAVVGFLAGLLLDLAPPADHTAGRWALAFVVVGYLAGLARRDARWSVTATIVVVAAGSFVATSLFALVGMALRDPGVTVDAVASVVPLAILYDLLLMPFVVPVVLAVMRRMEPASVRFSTVHP
ncbi:MAG TPA: rod shape-determining protein MreD [Nocardioidaceae bacterium]|nr:rod shape-determining protein MreD [Nocardioidaceae bacterium]